MKQRWSLIALVAVISFMSGGWLLQRGVASGGNVYQQARLFDDVLGHVNAYYVDSIGETDLYDRATRGMLEQLKDPYSVLLTGDDYKALTEQTSGNYAGLGIQIDVRDGWITVVAPLPETPAERAGVATGDQIIEVDGKSTEGWKNDEAVKALRGDAGSKVTITVRRSGVSDPIKYSLTRAQIHIRSVPAGTLFDGGVGYISLNPVAETSAEELRDEISAMKSQGHEVPDPRPPAQPGRPARPGREGGRPVPRQQAGDRRHPRPGARVDEGVLRRGQAGLARPADRRPGERRHRQRRRDHRGRAAGPRPRGGRGHADLRQGPGADALPAGGRRGAQAHDRALVHAERPDDPADREERGGPGDPGGDRGGRHHSG